MGDEPDHCLESFLGLFTIGRLGPFPPFSYSSLNKQRPESWWKNNRSCNPTQFDPDPGDPECSHLIAYNLLCSLNRFHLLVIYPEVIPQDSYMHGCRSISELFGGKNQISQPHICRACFSGGKTIRQCIRYTDCDNSRLPQMFPAIASFTYRCCSSNLCNSGHAPTKVAPALALLGSLLGVWWCWS